MKRKLSITWSFLSTWMLFVATSASGQDDVNVVQFLEAVRQTCGGTVSETISTTGNNISLKTTEVTVDPGTGSLEVRKDGVLLGEIEGGNGDSYRQCVADLVELLVGELQQSSKVPEFSGKVCTSSEDNQECMATTLAFSNFLAENTEKDISLDLTIEFWYFGEYHSRCNLEKYIDDMYNQRPHWSVSLAYSDERCSDSIKLRVINAPLLISREASTIVRFKLRGNFFLGSSGGAGGLEYKITRI